MAYDTSQREGESLTQWYRRLAKTADQRLVRLESYVHDKYFRSATRYAYRSAIRMIEGYSGEGARRFNTKPPDNLDEMMAKIGDMRAFIERPTSSKQGIISVYQARTNTINEKYKTNFTWQQLADYFESEENKKWDDKFGSKTAFNVIAVIQYNKEYLKDHIKEAQDKHIIIPDNLKSKEKMLRQKVKQALASNDLNIGDLITK